MGPPNTEQQDFEANKELINNLAQYDGKLVSPVDLTMDHAKPLILEKLKWVNLDDAPVKMKLTNSGETVIISGKWGSERPYLTGGPLEGSYVFSQIHFHWGSDEHEGSEHTVRGICYPMEVHVVFYKTRYLTQEAALKEDDGIIIVVYLVKLQEKSAQGLQWLAGYLDKVHQPQTSTVLPLTPLSALLIPFTKDYLLYWGSLVTHRCSHTMLWFVSRFALSISVENLNEFRKLLNSRKEPMNKNFRGASPSQGRTIFHVNPSKDMKHLLHQGTVSPPGECYIVNFSQMPPLDLVQAQKIFNRGDSTDDESKNSKSENNSPKPNKAKSSSNTYIFCEGTERDEVTNVANKVTSNSSAKRLTSKESVLCRSSPNRIGSYHQLGDEQLTWTKSQKRRSAMSRKILEKERRQEIENNKRKVNNKNEDISEGNGKPEKKLRKPSLSPNKKSVLTTKPGQPYSIQKPNERISGKHNSQPQVKNKNHEEQASEVCLHYNVSQISNGLSNQSPHTESLELKEDIPQETQAISNKDISRKEKPRSRLPVSSKGVLKSSLAQYFSRPETAPQGHRTENVKPCNTITKSTTPFITTDNLKRPIASTIPRPVGRNSGKLEDLSQNNELKKSTSSTIKAIE